MEFPKSENQPEDESSSSNDKKSSHETGLISDMYPKSSQDLFSFKDSVHPHHKNSFFPDSMIDGDPTNLFHLKLGIQDNAIGDQESKQVFKPRPPKIFPWISNNGQAQIEYLPSLFSNNCNENSDERQSFAKQTIDSAPHSSINNFNAWSFSPQIRSAKDFEFDGSITFLKNLKAYLWKLLSSQAISEDDCRLARHELVLLKAFLCRSYPSLTIFHQKLI